MLENKTIVYVSNAGVKLEFLLYKPAAQDFPSTVRPNLSGRCYSGIDINVKRENMTIIMLKENLWARKRPLDQTCISV